MEFIRDSQLNKIKQTAEKIFEAVLQHLQKTPSALSPTSEKTFYIWLHYTLDNVVKDIHIHFSPQDAVTKRGVSLSRIKQNLSEIYIAFNVCSEAELYMLVRIICAMLLLGIPENQIEESLWQHIRGLSPVHILKI